MRRLLSAALGVFGRKRSLRDRTRIPPRAALFLRPNGAAGTACRLAVHPFRKGLTAAPNSRLSALSPCLNKHSRTMLRIAAAPVCALLPAVVLAASNPNPGIIQTCIVPGISCLGVDFAGYFNSTVIAAARFAFAGVLVAAIIYYGLRRIFMPDSDSALDETRRSFEYAIFAAVLIVGADLIASSFVTGGVINPAGVNSVFTTVTTFVKGVIGVALLVNITIQGFRMITAIEDGEVAKGRKRFLFGCLGAAIVMVANPIVETLVGKSSSTAVTELKGIANYIITIFGLLAVVAIIVSGILLVISVDDSLKERARKLVTASVIALVLVISAGALVNFFILT